jgi:hypothetical protein
LLKNILRNIFNIWHDTCQDKKVTNRITEMPLL